MKRLIQLLVGNAAAAIVLLAGSANADAGTLWINACGSFGQTVFSGHTQPGLSARNQCPGGALSLQSSGTSKAGGRAYWQATAPSGITINHFWVGNDSLVVQGLNDGAEFGGGFYWQGGGATVHPSQTGYSSPTFSSPYVGWQMVCGKSSCPNDGSLLYVYQVQLQASETSGPGMAAPAGLWASGGWVRGSWPVSMNVWDPSGVCDEQAILNGRLVADVPVGKNQTAWQQCPNNPYLQTVNTAEYGAGAIPLTLKATNAADVSNAYTKTIYVDNQAPTISLSGPHDAPSTAGVQYVTATGSAGPSGVSGVACSLDGSPAQWRAGASMQTAIQGVGVHHLTCWSANDSRDANGVAAVSAPATWTLSIRLPTASAVGFSRLKSGLRCGRERELILVPAHWVTIRRHGKRVKVRRRGHLTTITVVRCHRSHSLGRQTATVVRFGSRTTVNGWLGTAQGVALGGQTIRIFTAADNGQYAFRQVGHARTARDGSWSARIPAGPSRIVRAVFDGGATIEPSGADARVVVPASVRLRISPRHAHWGGTIVISGQLRGGYVPPAGEVLFVRLRYNGKRIEVEHVRTSRDGRFHTTYTFLGGNGVAAYPFWVTTIPESDYPYAAGNSNKVVVTVSP